MRYLKLHRKYLAGLLLALCLSTTALAKSAKTVVANSDTQELVKVAKSYVRAFEAGDFKGLQASATKNFIEMIGGEKAVKDRFSKIPHEKSGKTSDPKTELATEVVKEDDRTFVHVGPKGEASGGMWFRAVKEDGRWKLDAPAPDFTN